jgi:hypothetical protein
LLTMLYPLEQIVSLALLASSVAMGQGTALPASAPARTVSATKAITTASASRKPSKKRSVKSDASQVATPPPQPAAIAPMTPEQLPANPPQVSYQNGQLTIQSDNSTLGDILKAVRTKTGAELEAPPGFGSERVATRLGPGPARDVITSLLSGSKFGYVILGSGDLRGIQKIIITGAQAPVSAAAQAASPAAMNQADDEDQEDNDVNVPVVEQPQPMPGPPGPQSMPVQPGPPGFPGAAVQPEGAPQGQFQPENPQNQIQQNQAQPQQGTGESGVKTPEQLLQELQRMRRGQQQQQQ